MSNYTEHLRLDFDPFAPGASSRDFYCSGQRQLLLDQIVEYSLYSNAMIAVTGPLGAGKSTLASNFCDRFSEEAICVKVTATLFMNQIQFLDPVQNALPARPSVSDDVDAVIAQICQYAAELDLEARSLILIIDDAHELSAEVFQLIIRLLENCVDSSIHALLFGENQLDNLLLGTLPPEAQERLAVFSLDGFASDETVEYIRFKMATAGFTGELPLTGGALGSIHNSSQGMPGAINSLMADALSSTVKIEGLGSPGSTEVDADETLVRSWLTSLQPRYWAIAATLVVALTATLIFWDTEPYTTENETTQQAAAVGSNGVARIELPVELASSTQSQSTEVTDVALLETVIESVTEPIISEQESLPASVVANDVPLETPSLATVSPAQEIDTAESAPIEVAIVEPVGNVENATPQGKKKEAVIPNLSDFEDRLLQSSPQNYTVQLLASHSEANMQDFIAKLETQDFSGYFETRYQDKPWFVAVVGDFADREAASIAITGLPENLRSFNPWVRSVADIQADIRLLKSTRLVSAK